MGILEKMLKNAINKVLGNTIEQTIENKISKTNSLFNNSYDQSQSYELFPKYSKPLSESSYETNTESYNRMTSTYMYDLSSVNSYIDEIQHYGFVKQSNVRYEKYINGKRHYIIVENKKDIARIVYHIEKF